MPTNYLTKEGYQKLQDDLTNLRENRRKEIAERLHNAIDEGGELVENAEYEAAKNEQAFVEGRIKELELLLASARIVEEDEPSDKVRIGSKVTIQEDDGDPEDYQVVGAAEANPFKGKISNESPLGSALMEQPAGVEVEVTAPDGTFKVKLLVVN
jgi:transcription elongation factor GreA